MEVIKRIQIGSVNIIELDNGLIEINHPLICGDMITINKKDFEQAIREWLK